MCQTGLLLGSTSEGDRQSHLQCPLAFYNIHITVIQSPICVCSFSSQALSPTRPDSSTLSAFLCGSGPVCSTLKVLLKSQAVTSGLQVR